MARDMYRRRRYCRFSAEGIKEVYQRQLTTAVKKARFLALLPYTDKH